MNVKFFSLHILLIGSLALTACQTTPDSHTGNAGIAPETEEAEAATRNFSPQELYDLMLAEMAGSRGDIPLALEKYSQHAFESRDPQLVERAALIANYSNDQQKQLELALLWSEIAPDNLDAHRLAATALARQGKFLQALDHAEIVLLQGDSEPLMTVAVLADRAGVENTQALLEAFPALEKRVGKNNFWVEFTQALLLRSSNNLPKASQHAHKALKLNPESESAALLLAQIQHQMGERDAALKTLDKALETHPQSKRLHVQYARFVAETDLVAARKLLDELVEKFPDDPQFAFTSAQLNQELGLADQSKRILQRLISNPDAASQAYYQLGLIEQQQNNSEAAINYFNQVRDPKLLVPVAARVSSLLATSGRLEETRLYLQKLRLNYPDQAADLFQIESEILIEHSRQTDAFGLLSTALETFPANIPLLYARSIVGEQLKNFQQAELDLRSILKIDEDNAMALNALGYTLTLHTNRYQEAHALILRALEISPDDPATLDSLGWVLFHLGRYNEAITHLESAWEKMPDPEIAAHLGEAYWVAGRKEDAVRVWQVVLEKHPENEKVMQTMQRLKKNAPE